MSNRTPPNGNNWGLYSDPKADELGAAMKPKFDPKERDAAVAELHEYVVDQAIWILVVHDLNPRALAHKVKGFKPPQSWYVDLTHRHRGVTAMLFFVLRRIAYVLPIAIGVSLICFALVYLAPGDPASAMIPDNTPPDVAADSAAYGFDKPLPVHTCCG